MPEKNATTAMNSGDIEQPKLMSLADIEETDLQFSDAESSVEGAASEGDEPIKEEFDSAFCFAEAQNDDDDANYLENADHITPGFDLGVNSMKPSISTRIIDVSDVSDEGDNVVEVQKKKTRKQRRSLQEIVGDRQPHAQQPTSTSIQPPAPRRSVDFESLHLSRPLLVNLSRMGFVVPTPVQSDCIPSALQGHDMMVNAVTGSGKTAGFMLPTLERLLHRQTRVDVTRVLVLLPTRELAAQCFDVSEKLALDTGIRVCLVVGGLSLQRQAAALKTRPDIVIATPGRLIDHLRNTQSVHLDDVEVLVLDEADRLLELGFVDEVQEVINACPRGRQTLLFSATLTARVSELADLSLKDPRRITVDPLYCLAENLSQEFVRVREQNDDTSAAIVLALCKRSFTQRCIVFFPSKRLAHRMLLIFGLAGLKAAELHGDLSQAQRLEALRQFRVADVDFLLCTDLAARGLDIDGVETVINFSFPTKLQQYVHRVGRTARAGRKGRAVTLVTDSSRAMLREILKKAREQVKSRKVAGAVIASFAKAIDDMRDKLTEIEADERLERKLRVAEMDASKMQNMLAFERDILNRPKRTWFQDSKQRRAASAVRFHQQPEEDTDEKGSMAAAGGKAPKHNMALAKIKRLPRRERRKKLARLQDEKERSEAIEAAQAEAVAQGNSPPVLHSAESKIRRIASDAKKKRRGQTDEQQQQRQKPQLDLEHVGDGAPEQQQKLRRRRRYEADVKDADSFGMRYASVAEHDETDNGSGNGKKAGTTSSKRKGSFNSKNRFKRRK